MAQWNPDKFGNLIAQRRRYLGISISDLAHEARLDPGTVHNLETGQVSNPSAATLTALADALGLSLSKVFSAAAPDSGSVELPSLAPYLRTKYPDLSRAGVTAVGDFFAFVQERYGTHRPAGGDDER